MPNYWWPPSPQHSDEETDDSQTEDEEEEDSSEGEEHEDSDGQHRQHNAFWKGFRAAIKGYASSSSSEGEEEEEEEGVHRDRWNDKDDEEDSDDEDVHLDVLLRAVVHGDHLAEFAQEGLRLALPRHGGGHLARGQAEQERASARRFPARRKIEKTPCGLQAKMTCLC